MFKRMKIQQTSLLIIIFLLGIMTTGCGIFSKEEKVVIDDFTFTDQNGEPFGLADLKGEVWVADFIFTSCTTVCPPMTANMVRLQKELKNEGLDDVQIVSFSVDPDVDTPERLLEYANLVKADLSNWHFLTGYSLKEIDQFARKNFKTLVDKPEGSDQVVHGTSFYLLDKSGSIVGIYSGVDNNMLITDLLKDIKKLK